MRRVPVLLVAAALAAASLGASGAGDPLRDRQYGLDAIGAPDAWSTSRGAGTVIAIVDTGIQLDHPDLEPKLLRDRAGRVVGYDATGAGTFDDENGHGTLVAGTAGAATGNGIGIAAVAPDAKLMPVRVLDSRGRGSLAAVDRGVRWAVDNGADVINLSLESSAPLPGDLVGSSLDAAVHYAWDRGVVVVAAAGNDGMPFTDYRSSTPVLLVGATDARDRQTTFSDSGRRDMVLAPGADIVSTGCDPCRRGGSTATYRSASGTSFAAPHVAGAVAVLLATGRSHTAAVKALRETAVPVPRPATSLEQGHGRIDLAAAVTHGRTRSATASGGRSTQGSTGRSAAERTTASQPPRSEPTPTPRSPASRAPAAGTPAGGTPAGDDPAASGEDRAPTTDGLAEPLPEADPSQEPASATSDEPSGLDADEVAVPAPTDGDGTPALLVTLAGSLVLLTGSLSLRALSRDARSR